MASSVPDWVYLTDDEELLWVGHPSFRPIIPALVFGAGLVVLGLALTAIITDPIGYAPLVLTVIGVGVALRAYLERWAVRYAITTEEAYKKTGIVSRDVTQLRLDRVQNTNFSQSLLERALSYGDIRLDTAGTGGTELVFEDIDRPAEVIGIVNRRLSSIGAGGVNGSQGSGARNKMDHGRADNGSRDRSVRRRRRSGRRARRSERDRREP
jgi:membrane protein YdbS with pleckstrin-like domain